LLVDLNWGLLLAQVVAQHFSVGVVVAFSLVVQHLSHVVVVHGNLLDSLLLG